MYFCCDKLLQICEKSSLIRFTGQICVKWEKYSPLVYGTFKFDSFVKTEFSNF